MANDLINYVQGNLARGVSREKIETYLLQIGWQKEQIDAVFVQLESGQAAIEKKPDKKMVLLAGLLLIIILMVTGGILFVKSQNQKPVTSTKTVTGKTEVGGGSVSITAPVTTTESCGSQDCFNQKFQACAPATLDAISPVGSVHYEIYGPKNSGCNMLFKYTKNPNPDWVDKDLICIFDNKLAFENSVADTFKNISSPAYACQGPLVAELKKDGL